MVEINDFILKTNDQIFIETLTTKPIKVVDPNTVTTDNISHGPVRARTNNNS